MMLKRIGIILIFLLFTTGGLSAQDVSITDYQVPVSQAKNMYLNLDYNYTARGDSTISDNGTAKLIYKHFYYSLPFSWRVEFDGSATKIRDDYQSAFVLSSNTNKYFSNASNFFGFGQLQASHADQYKQIQSRISAGAGYGRFISATAFAKAIRIDHFLLNEGVTTGHLDKETLVKIGNIIERESEYRSRYGATYEPRWYEDIEKIIKESGKLKKKSIGAIGILRIKEVLFFERIQDRFYGWEARAGLAYDITTSDKSESKPSVELGLSFAYPIALQAQFTHQTQINSDFEDFGEIYTVLSNTSYIYELSNRIDWLLGYQLQVVRKNINLKSLRSHALRTSFIFYIENQINLVLNGQLDKTGDKDWNKNITLTLGYRIL